MTLFAEDVRAFARVTIFQSVLLQGFLCFVTLKKSLCFLKGKETGGYSEVRILECDIYKRYPSSSKEEALLHFQEMFGAYRVKATLYSDSGVKWAPYSDIQYDIMKLSEII